jgi:hypothetical protein
MGSLAWTLGVGRCAVALDRAGRKHFDMSPPNDDVRLRKIFAGLSEQGTILLVMKQPGHRPQAARRSPSHRAAVGYRRVEPCDGSRIGGRPLRRGSDGTDYARSRKCRTPQSLLEKLLRRPKIVCWSWSDSGFCASAVTAERDRTSSVGDSIFDPKGPSAP